MRKTVILQSPSHLYEVVPIFYKELNKLGYFDHFYLVTDQQNPDGLGDNVTVVQLDRDLGRANNFLKLLEVVKEDVFVMMCDDHVVTQQGMNLDRYFELVNQNQTLGRLQLSPPSSNYLKYMRGRYGSQFVPDYSREYEIYPKEYRWHINFQPSIWRKDFFEYCIRGGENRNKLEIRAGLRGKEHPTYRSGFIFEHAVQVDNYYASCKVHTADPSYDRMKNSPHYREEFMIYAREHDVELKPDRNVYVKRKHFVASIPQDKYLEHYNDDEALSKWAVKSSPVRSLYAKVTDHFRMTFGS